MTPLFFWEDEMQEIYVAARCCGLVHEDVEKGHPVTYDDDIDIAIDVKRALKELRSR